MVGAGPTGLALALQLQRLRVDFRIIDKEGQRSATSKAIGLQTRVSEVLAWMGLASQFFARGLTLSGGMRMYAGGRSLVRLRFEPFLRELERRGGRGAFVPQPIFIPQSETEAILEEALEQRGNRVDRRTSFVSFSQDAETVLARVALPDGRDETIEAKYLVSCEGAHSILRKQGGFTFAGKTYPMQLFMADVKLDWTRPHGTVHIFFHPDGACAALPLPDDVWRLIIDVGAETADEAPEVTLELMQRLLAERTGDAVTRASHPTWLTSFRINCRMVDHFRNGRVFLAGDAAHIHSPTGGQGITTGVQDAWNLGWKLAQVLQRGAPESLLDSYEDERLPIAKEVLASTDTNTRVFLGVTPAMRIFRDLVFVPLLRMQPVHERLFRRVSQLSMNYRGRGLSRHRDASVFSPARVRAGDRTPDIVFRDASTGAEVSLFRLLEACRPIVLVDVGASAMRSVRALAALGLEVFVVGPNASATAPSGVRGLVDVHGDFRRIYARSGGFLYLIRPDGYAGLFLRPVREPALRDYLSGLFSADAIVRAFRHDP